MPLSNGEGIAEVWRFFTGCLLTNAEELFEFFRILINIPMG